MRRITALIVVASVVFGSVCTAAPAKKPEESTDMELTVYNTNMALVKDTRQLRLKRGVNTVEFTDVASEIDPTSVHFESLTAPGRCTVLEQNYQYDLVSRSKLLQKYLGKAITVTRQQQGGGAVTTTGKLLSSQNGLVLQTQKGILMAKPDSIQLPQLPEGLIIKPTLNWLIDSRRPGKHRVEVSYITSEIQWECDYVSVVNADDSQLDVNGWVTIDNKSGATYSDAKLKLIAGDVKKAKPERPRRRVYAKAAGGGRPQFEEKAFFEYHIYSMDRRTTVRDNETKQVELLSARDVPVTKRYFFDGQRTSRRNDDNKGKIQVKLQFDNSTENNLGMALPKGKVRVYKADDEGSLQFIGEDRIDHTPEDEQVRLYVGDAFDIVGEWKQTGRRKIADKVWETGVQIELRNHKDEDIEVTCVEHATGDWRIVEESHEHTKKDATTFEYTVPVGADGETTVTYTVRTTR